MRIEPPRSSSLAALETQEAAPTNNNRPPRGTLSQQPPSTSLPPLELGLELEATVVDELAGGRLLLQIGGSIIDADGPAGLTAGQQLRVRVEQLQPHIILHITEAEPTILSQATTLLRQHLPAHADQGELLENLQKMLAAHLQKLDVEGRAAPSHLVRLLQAIENLLPAKGVITPELVQALLENGGLYYEAKIARAAALGLEDVEAIVQDDLKGLFLAVLEKAPDPGPNLLRSVNAQLENLEAQQAVNLLHQLNDGAFQFQIPFFNGNGFSTATLSVERDGKGSVAGEPGADGYRLLFLLDLENFGRTRIDVHLTGSILNAAFYVDRRSSINLLNQEIPAFRETLAALGYSEVWLVAKPLKEIPEEKRQKFDALAVGAPPAIHLIDVKV
jgi:hypothetical protein